MNAQELYRAGRLGEAVQALSVELRDNPGDKQRRTFLFELLCFAGNYDRAQKQLDILAQEGGNTRNLALLCHGALNAERARYELFTSGSLPSADDCSHPAGTWNEREFSSIEDADPRIGPRLEVFVGGQYVWVRFEDIVSIEINAPKKLRDLLWIPAEIRTAASFEGADLGDVLLPALAPLSSQESDDAIKLGRVTEWRELPSGEIVPVGQKEFLIHGEEVAILDLRNLRLKPTASANQHVSA